MSVTRARMAFAMNAPALRGTGTPAAWAPTDLGASLKEWWNADDTANGIVSTWTGRTGSTAPTAAAGLEPISAATSFNGAYRGLTFDGVDDCLVATSFPALPIGATGGELWALCNNTSLGSAAATRSIVNYGNGTGGAGSRILSRVGISTVNRLRISDGTTPLIDTLTDAAGYHIWGAYWSGTTEGARIDGQDISPATATIATLNTVTGRLRIGAGHAVTATGFLQGSVRHIFATLTLTTLQRQQLEGWMAWDAALQSILVAGHPYKSARP